MRRREGADMGIIMLCSILLAALALCGVAFRRHRRRSARRYVAQRWNHAVAAARSLERVIWHPDAKKGAQDAFLSIKGDLSQFSDFLQNPQRIDWVARRTLLVAIEKRLSRVEWATRREIVYAEKARREGPALLAEIPALLAATARTLSEGNNSWSAMRRFNRARAQWADAEIKLSLGIRDWKILYPLLADIRFGCMAAAEVHRSANHIYRRGAFEEKLCSLPRIENPPGRERLR